MTGFLKAYFRSMRPYTFFITGTSGLAGILAVGGTSDIPRTTVSLVLLFLAYGINQVVNDLLGTREDRLNKAERPAVTGEMDRKKAWWLTGAFFLFGGIITFFLNHHALIIYVAGYAFNVIYEELKGVPMVGNLWFGAMISMAPIYGAMATTDLAVADVIGNESLLGIALLVLLVQSNMCYFTYFKDVEGDRKAGKRTLVVLFGSERARFLSIVMVPVPYIAFACLYFLDVWGGKPGLPSIVLISFSLAVYVVLTLWLIRDPSSKRGPLELNFQGAVLFQNGLIAIFSVVSGLALGFSSFVLMAVIFRLMYRKRFYG